MDNVIELTRGGYLVNTDQGSIQFGSPPETIKDTMMMPEGVPQYFVLPEKFFNWIKGISVAEVEFPIYYNFFLKKRKTYIICQKDQKERFSGILRESLFGPEHLDLLRDFADTFSVEQIPDLRKELDFFRGSLNLDLLVEFLLFDDNKVKINDLTLSLQDDNLFVLKSGKSVIAKVPSRIEYKPKYDIGQRLLEPYNPPLFGMTCLGPSHGFDPAENTSGFILWINRRGIMIDPPVNTTEWLIDSNVNPKLITSIILTHCHADHDAGTLQKILEEGKINVYTTRTVMESFLRKYGSLTNVSSDYMQQLFRFLPVEIGKTLFINGARFSFFYSLHSIPTVGFRVEFDNKSMVYSSDHNADPELHKKMFDEGVVGKNRYKQLSEFPWDADIVYHEAGIPPLHTPVAYLNSMEKETQEKTHVYHIAKKDFPEDTSLTLCEFGIEHTRVISVNTPEYEKTYHILGLLTYMDVFQDIHMFKIQEFISIIREEEYPKGAHIIKKGSKGDKFYIIKSGNISVAGDDLKHRKIYGVYDSFGEVALLNDKPRSVDIFAETDVVLYTIEKEKFLHFIHGTELERILLRLSRVRNFDTWNVLSTSPFFRILTSSQKTTLESILHPLDINKSGNIVVEGKKQTDVYIVREGEVEISRKGKLLKTIGRGGFIGEVRSIFRDEPAICTYSYKKPLSLYRIKQDDVNSFIKNNPGLLMKLSYDFLDGLQQP